MPISSHSPLEWVGKQAYYEQSKIPKKYLLTPGTYLPSLLTLKRNNTGTRGWEERQEFL